ncbi:hypothetical protein SDC9_105233 [bioreactor metagenome]|uniref:Uncharacterized protein n=1 Tax=bioreactor metagenome TaxID=1076179 RepID=A0A645AYY8_9ZZZZ
MDLQADAFLVDRRHPVEDDMLEHDPVFADITARPPDQHPAELAVSIRDAGPGDRVALENHLVSVLKDHGRDGAVFADLGRGSHESLIQPFGQERHHRAFAVGAQGARGAHHEADHALRRTDDFEPEHEPDVHHLRQEAVAEILDPDIAGDAGDALVGEGRNDVAQAFAVHDGVAVHGDHDIEFRHQNALVERVLLALVAGQIDGDDFARGVGGGAADPVAGVVLGTVVDGDDLQLFHRIIGVQQTVERFRNMLAFIIGRDDDRTAREPVVGQRRSRLVAERIRHDIEHVQQDQERHGEEAPGHAGIDVAEELGVVTQQRRGQDHRGEEDQQQNCGQRVFRNMCFHTISECVKFQTRKVQKCLFAAII